MNVFNKSSYITFDIARNIVYSGTIPYTVIDSHVYVLCGVNGHDELSFLAGGVGKFEDYMACAVRETYEETAGIVDLKHPVYITNCPVLLQTCDSSKGKAPQLAYKSLICVKLSSITSIESMRGAIDKYLDLYAMNAKQYKKSTSTEMVSLMWVKSSDLLVRTGLVPLGMSANTPINQYRMSQEIKDTLSGTSFGSESYPYMKYDFAETLRLLDRYIKLAGRKI